MGAAGGDGGDTAQQRDICWRVSLGGGAVTELPFVVVAPAFHCAGREQRTRVVVAGGDGGDTAQRPRDIYWHLAGADNVWDTELLILVVAPAFHCAGREQRTRVVLAGGDGGDTARQPKDIVWYGSPGGVVVTELPRGGIAPAFHCAGREQRTRVGVAGGDGGDTARQPRDSCW